MAGVQHVQICLLAKYRSMGQSVAEIQHVQICLLAKYRGIDQSVAGIQHTTGGSTAAYTRWEKFKLAGLNQYAAKRNNSMLRNAVSRQSG